MHLRSIVQNLSTSESGDDGSEKVCEGPYKLDKTGQNFENVEEFVAGLRVEQRGKLDMVSIKL